MLLFNKIGDRRVHSSHWIEATSATSMFCDMRTTDYPLGEYSDEHMLSCVPQGSLTQPNAVIRSGALENRYERVRR